MTYPISSMPSSHLRGYTTPMKVSTYANKRCQFPSRKGYQYHVRLPYSTLCVILHCSVQTLNFQGFWVPLSNSISAVRSPPLSLASFPRCTALLVSEGGGINVIDTALKTPVQTQLRKAKKNTSPQNHSLTTHKATPPSPPPTTKPTTSPPSPPPSPPPAPPSQSSPQTTHTT